MLMTGDEISAAYEEGEIVIDPFCAANVNTASYDVSLGPLYYRQTTPVQRGYRVRDDGLYQNLGTHYNPYDQQLLDLSWKLEHARPIHTLPGDGEGIGNNDLVIPIEPKEIILAHTLEFIGSVPQPNGISITTQMHARSSTVRNCIDVCGSGGFGDMGFCNRWTLEITNTSPHYTCYLVVGRRYAQISFWRTTPILRNYAAEGKYHAGMDLEQLRSSWHPSMMLSRSYQDREVGKPNQHRKLINTLIQNYPAED